MSGKSTARLYSAAEIAGFKLLGLPHTKPSIIERAKREGWYFEEMTALGGKRRMYRIPARYLKGNSIIESTGSVAIRNEVEGQTAQVNLDFLRMAETSVEAFVQANKLQLTPHRRALVVAFLYDYVGNKGATQDEVLLFLTIMTG
jgi:hypothetical protein